VARESDQKRYEFEAENSTVAGEFVNDSRQGCFLISSLLPAEIVEEINSIIKRTK